ncbi:MAG TPA: nucleotide exchange factor GrpE [Acidimicrobiia bacterium]|nr:nucleotide exchange factor GrpE [Acidimicrobiia bacterium]
MSTEDAHATSADEHDAEPRHGEEVGATAFPPMPSADALGLDLPDDPEEAVQVLLTAVAEARSEAGRYLDDLRRVAADFDNYRKRATRDQHTIVERAAERVLSSMLPVLDSFDAALAIEATTETEQQLLRGMRSTHSQLMDVLAKEGLEAIPSVGEPFDPEVHEAVMTSGGDGPLVVATELRRGYRLRGRVLRAALVALEEAS